MQREKKYRFAVLSIALILVLGLRMEAWAAEPAGRSLIQSVTEESEWQGMRELGLFDTPVLEIEDEELAMENVLPSVVAVRVGNYLGSGTVFRIMDNSLFIVSNRHVVQTDSDAVITFFNGKTAKGKIAGVSVPYDLAFIEVLREDIPEPARRQIRQVTLDTNRVEQLDYGTNLFLMASADGAGENRVVGTVLNPREYFEEFGSFMIHSYSKGKPGMSGGGTFDACGYYLGMLTGGLGEESASLPADLILEEFQAMDFSE